MAARRSSAPGRAGGSGRWSPWMTQHRAAHRAGRSRKASCSPERSARASCRSASVGVDLQPPADAILDLLGRVRLVEHLGEEAPGTLVVAVPVVALCFAQPSSRRARSSKRRGDLAAPPGASRAATAGRRRRLHALGMVGGEQRRPERAAGERRRGRRARRPPRPSRRRRRRRTRLQRSPRRRADGPSRRAAPVEGQHAEVPREVRDLRLPEARVDDRPRRQQQRRSGRRSP